MKELLYEFREAGLLDIFCDTCCRAPVVWKLR